MIVKNLLKTCLLIIVALFIACDKEDETPVKPETKGFVELEYLGRKLRFDEVNVGRITKNNVEIGKFFYADREDGFKDNPRNRIFMYFLYNNEEKTNLIFNEIEFIPYEYSKSKGVIMVASVYNKLIDGYPFQLTNFSYDNKLNVKGNFEGTLFFTDSLADTLSAPPVRLTNGYFEVSLN